MTPEKVLDETIRRYEKLGGIWQNMWDAYSILKECFLHEGCLLVCGNGGSAADALHIVGELMKSFVIKRPVDHEFARNAARLYPDSAEYLTTHLEGALRAIALVENCSLSTAFANDVCEDMAYAQQVYGYGRSADVLLGISTSGNAANVIHAVKTARTKGMKTIGLTGGTGGELAKLCDLAIIVPETETHRIQELHLPVYHALCRMLELHFFEMY